MEPQEQGQPLLRKDDFSEEVISQILKKGSNQKEKDKMQNEIKVVTHLIHVICKGSSEAEACSLGPPVKSCKVCGDAVDGHYVVQKHSFLEPSTDPYMCGICGEAFGQGYLLKIHLELEHGFVEKDSNRRSLRIRNKSQEVRSTRQGGGVRKERKKGEEEAGSNSDVSQKETSPGVEHRTGGEVDSGNQDKENESRESERKLRTTPDKTILLRSNSRDNLVENDEMAGAMSDEEGRGDKNEGKGNSYKNGDLIVINLFTEGGTLPAKRSRRTGQQNGDKTEGSDKYKCEFCELGFRSQQKRGVHIKEVHPNCPLKCHQCQAEFSERRLLNIHAKSHRRVRRPPAKPKEVKKHVPPVCKLCNKTFLHQSGLQIHTQNFHPELVKGQKTFCCEKCGAMFWTHTAMVEHQRIHLDTKPFVCSHCKKGFCRRSDLKSHVKVHTGEKPYKCSHCDKAFRQRLQMVNHVRTHTGEKPYKCEFCEKAFVKRDQYTRHRRVHTKERPYKCSHCEKFFKSRSNLNDHERVHTGVKPFKCKHCDKAFAQYTNLVHHVRIHTGHKPYVCPQCQKPFPRSNSLKAHMKSHQKNAEVSGGPSLPPPSAGADVQPRSMPSPMEQPSQLQELQPLHNLPIYQTLQAQQQATTTSVIANASEILASMQVSIVPGLEDVSSVSQHDIGGRFCQPVESLVAQASVTNMIAGGPVTPVASFIPNGTINGFGVVENEAAAACESIVVLANMNDYQPMHVTQNMGAFQ